MNTQLRFFGFIYLARFVMPILAEVPEARLNEMQALIKSNKVYDGNQSEQQPFSKWIMELNAEERAALIPVVRKFADKGPPYGEADKQEWYGLLAYLGDEQAMIANIDYWRRAMPTGSLTVERAESGQLPLYVEPELFREEIYEGYANPATPSFLVADFILYYLHYNKYYPQEVRDWAGRTINNRVDNHRDTADLTPIRRVVREWYRANEAFIRAKQYDKVKAGEELPPRPSLLKESGLSENPPLPAISRRQGRDIAPTPMPASSTTEPERKPTANYAIYATVAAILGVIALFFRKRLLRRKR